MWALPKFHGFTNGEGCKHLVAPKPGAHGLRVQVGSLQRDSLCQVSD